jgi:hypothetical protein
MKKTYKNQKKTRKKPEKNQKKTPDFLSREFQEGLENFFDLLVGRQSV